MRASPKTEHIEHTIMGATLRGQINNGCVCSSSPEPTSTPFVYQAEIKAQGCGQLPSDQVSLML